MLKIDFVKFYNDEKECMFLGFDRTEKKKPRKDDKRKEWEGKKKQGSEEKSRDDMEK